MHPHKLVSKLRPLIPDKVSHWLRARETADPDLKTLLDKQIYFTGQRLLGDYRNKILLSLPPEAMSKGEFNLGTIQYDGDRWPFGLSRTELMQHLALFGRSGAGKSNAVFHLLKQLHAKKIPWVFLDWKRTARHILPLFNGKVKVYTPGRSLSSFQFNPFIVPPGLEANVYINMLIDVMAEAYTLGDGAKRVLQKAIFACYSDGNSTPSPLDILKEVHVLPDTERQRSWKISTIRALESMKFSGMDFSDADRQKASARSLTTTPSIIELDALDQSTKKFLIPMLCLWIYQTKMSSPRRENLDLVIVVEEAHHVFYRQEQRSKETLMNMLMRQCREIGIGVIVVDQHPSLISQACLGNCYTTVCMNLKDPTDINRAAGLSLLDSEDKRYLSMIPVGQGIVKIQDRWREAFLLKFPLVDVRKGSVSDRDLELYLRSIPSSGSSAAGSLKTDQVRPVRISDSVLGRDAWLFLQDVIAFPLDGVKARYRRLGMSADRGTRVKGELVQKGWLEASTVAVGRFGRKIALRPSKWALEALKLDSEVSRQTAEPSNGRNRLEPAPNPPPGKSKGESLKHEYWKGWWTEKLRGEGWRVVQEAPRRGGRVDVLAISPDGKERIGVEVETGMSDVLSNVRNGLLSGFKKVIVVPTDQKARVRIEQSLAKAGLLILDRVELSDE